MKLYLFFNWTISLSPKRSWQGPSDLCQWFCVAGARRCWRWCWCWGSAVRGLPCTQHWQLPWGPAPSWGSVSAGHCQHGASSAAWVVQVPRVVLLPGLRLWVIPHWDCPRSWWRQSRRVTGLACLLSASMLRASVVWAGLGSVYRPACSGHAE